jgi:two-component system phosphate regulon sensor histidine kinase PhoR
MAVKYTVDILEFLLGLSVGLGLWGWQQVRLNYRLTALLQDLKFSAPPSTLSLTSRLALAIAYQQKSLQQLEQQVETWRQVFYSAPMGYLQVDEENQLIWCNQQARQLLGIQQWNSAQPRLLLELVRSYELDQLIEQTRDAQKPCEREWVFYPPSADPSNLSHQRTYPVRGYGLPLLDSEVGIFLENRQEAVTLVQQRDRWASDVAHELKTPLTSIRLVAETLQTRLEPSLRKWIDRLLNEVIRLSNLVQDLLELGQLDKGVAPCLNLKTFDLTELIHAAWLSLEPLARNKQLQLSYVGPEHLLMQADEPRLYRVLINLLDNSIKHSPPQQLIRVQVSIQEQTAIAAELPTQQIHLEVIDAGPGFPESALPFVFDRFYRVDLSRSRHVAVPKTSGISMASSGAVGQFPNSSLSQRSGEQTVYVGSNSSGLGLAIVRQIVEAHSGSVSASNHPDTGGAWLQVFLPWQQSRTNQKS